MVFLFRDKSIANIFFLLLLSIAVHFHFFVNAPLIVTAGNDGIFSLLIAKYLVFMPGSVLFILYHAVVLIQAIRLNMVLSDLRMYQHHTYTPAMVYVLFSGVMIQWCSISSALFANFLLIWIFVKLSKLYNHPSPKTLLFNTGLLVGVSIVCYHPTAILVLAVLFSLAVVRPFRLAEWLILLMGALLPFYFLFSWLFLRNYPLRFLSFLPSLQFNLPLPAWDTWLIVALSLLTLTLVLGLYFWERNINRMVIQIRKNWGVMMVMLFVLLPAPFVFAHAGIESAMMILLPLSVVAANAFSYPRRLVIPNILFWLVVALIIHNNMQLLKI